MPAAQPLIWRHRFPVRALRRLGWYLLGGGSVAAASWVLFGAEPNRLPSGEPNPLALVPLITTLLLAAAGAPLLLRVFRRPQVAADHYALTVRPGLLRTLLLPWASVAEVTAVPVRGDPVLLVRCRRGRGHTGDRPRWYDQGVLRAAGDAGAGYDLAVRLDEFAGAPADRLGSLAAWAPGQVAITDALDD